MPKRSRAKQSFAHYVRTEHQRTIYLRRVLRDEILTDPAHHRDLLRLRDPAMMLGVIIDEMSQMEKEASKEGAVADFAPLLTKYRDHIIGYLTQTETRLAALLDSDLPHESYPLLNEMLKINESLWMLAGGRKNKPKPQPKPTTDVGHLFRRFDELYSDDWSSVGLIPRKPSAIEVEPATAPIAEDEVTALADAICQAFEAGAL